MEKSFFFNAVVTNGVADRIYSAEDIAERESCLLSDGVIGADSLKVRGISSNEVYISRGVASVKGYTYFNTAEFTLPLEAGDATYDRIDTVALRLDLSNRFIKAVILKGFPAANPIARYMTNSQTVREIPLADIYVPAGSAPSVENSQITDRRVLAGYANMKEDLLQVIREYIGEMDPVKSSEVSGLRRLLSIISEYRGKDTVLCGDGVYREIPLAEREVAAEFILPGTYTFELTDCPSEDDIYDIEIQGAGGGGGCYNGITKRGGGGGGGAYLYVKGVKLLKDRCTVVVGAGGNGGLGTDGKDGGASSFDGFTAEGGHGGSGGVSAVGGQGGMAMYRGGNGYDGDPMDGTELYPQCGKGGFSRYGDGAAAPMGRVSENGNDAENLGAGGSGASCATGAFDKRGGRGGDGIVVLYRYVKNSTEA